MRNFSYFVDMAKILVVEDTKDLADQISDIFRIEGHHVTVASDGLVALNLLLSRTIVPDVIVTDIVMPQLDGFELIEELKKTQDFKDIPVIIMSAKSDRNTVDRASSLAVKQFLPKPCPPQKLIESIMAALN